MTSTLAVLMGLLIQAPQFDVASVKPNTGGPGPTMVQLPPTGRVTIVNATFRMLLRSSYRLQDQQIEDSLEKIRLGLLHEMPFSDT